MLPHRNLLFRSLPVFIRSICFPITPKFYHRHTFFARFITVPVSCTLFVSPFTSPFFKPLVKPFVAPFINPFDNRKMVCSVSKCDEALNSCYRRLNKQRSIFPSSQALMKALYLGTFEIAKKWTMPIRNWGKVRGELEIMYPDRMLI